MRGKYSSNMAQLFKGQAIPKRVILECKVVEWSFKSLLDTPCPAALSWCGGARMRMGTGTAFV